MQRHCIKSNEINKYVLKFINILKYITFLSLEEIDRVLLQIISASEGKYNI